jgi:hypothetical protein
MQTSPWWSLWWEMAECVFGESLEPGGRFCVGAFVSHREDVFTFSLLFKEIFVPSSMKGYNTLLTAIKLSHVQN